MFSSSSQADFAYSGGKSVRKESFSSPLQDQILHVSCMFVVGLKRRKKPLLSILGFRSEMGCRVE